MSVWGRNRKNTSEVQGGNALGVLGEEHGGPRGHGGGQEGRGGGGVR